MGKIKITRKVTVKQQVRVQRRVQVTSQPITYTQPVPQISTAPVQKALNDLSNEVKNAQRQLESSSRRRILPSGVYSKPVEDVFYALDERRKPENLESQAMYDVFISHASEDKKEFVAPLVEKLQDAGITVWYDALELQWGKSLREQIDNGIKRSKFAILVLSKTLF